MIVAGPDVTAYPVIVNPVLGNSPNWISLPAAMADGPLLCTVTVKVVFSPAFTLVSSATLLMFRSYSRSTGIGGVSCSSSGSSSGGVSGPHTFIVLLIVAGGSVETVANTFTIIRPFTGTILLTVIVALLSATLILP